MRTRAQAADPAALDLPYLSTTFGFLEVEVQALLDAPTAELVRDFFTSLTNKGHDWDALKAEKLRADVELENTVRTSDSKAKAQKAQVVKHVKEVEELRVRLSDAESAREALTSELELLRSSTSGSIAESQTLRQRVETLETSNRDAFALVESKSTEKDCIATELSEQHGKVLVIRREISQLEERNQALQNAASSQKFKEQSLQQEIDLLKRNNEWHSNELQTRNQEHARFRKERNARIASLQRELDESTANVETLKRTETNLRQRLDEVQAKTAEAFERVASLQEEAARKEQAFKTELDSCKRLADLQAQNAATHKARLQDVQGQIDKMQEDAADEIGRLQAEVETERSDKEEAERKVAGLELALERLERQPGTPTRNGGHGPTTPARIGSRADSPAALPGSLRKTVNGMSFTQLYAQFTEAQQELEAERRRTDKLSETMDSLLSDLENKAPEIVEMKQEQLRLEAEVLEFSRLLDEANHARDGAVKEAQHWHSEARAAVHEGEVLRQQLRDLSAQIKILLVEIQSRDQGLADMSAEERLELERAARGEIDDDVLDHMTDTDRLISERLVIYRDVSELQEQNQKLLRLGREIGQQLEGQEAQEKQRQNAAFASENEDLRQRLQRMQDELQATATQIDSYAKERDMFRRMLKHRGQIAPDVDLQSVFGQSVGPPATPQRNSGTFEPPTPRSKDVEDLNKLIKEQQTFFDQYRTESATDRKQLKDQVDTLSREKSTLQADIARAQSQLTLASERFEMLQSNFSALRNENSELQKRSQQMAENAAKQDLRTQQVAEELVEARSMTESLRNENANSKAEKELWRRIESRLTEDNKSLMDERSRLNKLVTDLQNLQNERELADSDSRRRLQTKTEALESELAETKRKLEQEVEFGRKATLRREYEESQSRTRIDELVKSLGTIREELVAAKTTRDQVQARVEEMKVELRSAEEKAALPTSRAQPEQETNGDLEVSEQRPALEVLHRDLEIARNALEAAKQQVEQYRSIAQTTEEELASFNETSEQYKEDTDRLITEKDARAKELEQRVEDISTELTTTNNELSELRTKHDDSSRALDQQKSSFESEVARLRDDAERHAEEKKLYQEDLKAQAEIAQQAQQSYEDELVKHAEAAKGLQTVRKDYNELRTEVAGIRAEAEAARVSLDRGEESWTEQRERFERELEEVKRRREDVDKQNKLLHEQMDTFSAELAALRQGRAAPVADHEAAGNLQEVIKYLRREKDIVDAQYEFSIHEAKRLQQQLDYANSQLEETGAKLAEERRLAADHKASEGSTNKLMQTLNELNLFRESSTTLRNEARQAREKLEEKSKEVERLMSEMEPLKGRIGELEGELESKDGELKLVQDDRDHWRERTQNIISKYDRVDPAELEEMKQQLQTLNAEREKLRGQVDGFEATVAEAKSEAERPYIDRLQKFRDQAKDQNRKQNDKIRVLGEEKEKLASELDMLKVEVEQVKTALEDLKTALHEAQAKAQQVGDDEDEEGEVREDEEHATLRARIAEAETNASEHVSRAETLNGQVQTLQARVEELEGQVTSLQLQLDDAKSNQTQADSETLEQLRRELSTAQQEVETLRASNTTTEDQPVASAEAVEGERSVAAQVAEEVAKLRTEMEQQHALALNQVEEERDRRIESLKESLKRQLREKKEAYQNEARQELLTQHSAELQKLKEEHEATIARLTEEHQVELTKLQKADGTEGVVKAETTADGTFDPTHEQVEDLVKNNQRVRSILQNNIRKGIAAETEKLHKTIADRDEELSKLKEAQGNAGSDAEKEEIAKQLQAAKQDKENAVRQAVENAEKKARVQVSQRDMAQAKIQVVSKAALETPDKPVKEVWEIAKVAKPAPKQPAPPSPAQTLEFSSQAQQTPEQTEQAKLIARQQRFWTGSAQAQREASSSGQPSTLPSAAHSNAVTPAGQPTPNGGTPPNPQAPVFMPGADASANPLPPRPNFVTGPAALRGTSSAIPRGSSGLPRGPGAAGRGGISIQGAANAQQPQQPQASYRGGLQSGLPRGGSNIGRGGRGAQGSMPRGGGGAGNGGQKRQYEGGPGGDEKRMRGGGGPGGGGD